MKQKFKLTHDGYLCQYEAQYGVWMAFAFFSRRRLRFFTQKFRVDFPERRPPPPVYSNMQNPLAPSH